MFLDNIDEIVAHSLPLQNLQSFFDNKDVAETYLLNQVTFCEEMVQVPVHSRETLRTQSLCLLLCMKIRIVSTIPLRFSFVHFFTQKSENQHFRDLHFFLLYLVSS